MGKYVLIGVTYYSHEGEWLGREQMHGRVVGVDEDGWLDVLLEGAQKGRRQRIPGDAAHLEAAAPGSYESETGEIIIDPDYLGIWNVTLAQGKTLAQQVGLRNAN